MYIPSLICYARLTNNDLVIRDYNANKETPLPPMPNNAAFVYSASGAVNLAIDTALQDCQRITPKPADGSTVKCIQDDSMTQGRTMRQFTFPDGTRSSMVERTE